MNYDVLRVSTRMLPCMEVAGQCTVTISLAAITVRPVVTANSRTWKNASVQIANVNPFMVIASAISPMHSGRSYYALGEKYFILITDKIIIRPNFGSWCRRGFGRWTHTGSCQNKIKTARRQYNRMCKVGRQTFHHNHFWCNGACRPGAKGYQRSHTLVDSVL
jgi:hypothetical protein